MDIDNAHLCAIGSLAITAAKLEFIARSLDPEGNPKVRGFTKINTLNRRVIEKHPGLDSDQKQHWKNWLDSADAAMKRRNAVMHAFWSMGSTPDEASAYDLSEQTSQTYTVAQINKITSELNQLTVDGFLFRDEVNDSLE